MTTKTKLAAISAAAMMIAVPSVGISMNLDGVAESKCYVDHTSGWLTTAWTSAKAWWYCG